MVVDISESSLEKVIESVIVCTVIESLLSVAVVISVDVVLVVSAWQRLLDTTPKTILLQFIEFAISCPSAVNILYTTLSFIQKLASPP